MVAILTYQSCSLGNPLGLNWQSQVVFSGVNHSMAHSYHLPMANIDFFKES